MAISESQLCMKRTFSQRSGRGEASQAAKKRVFAPCTGPLQMALVHHKVHSKSREQCATDLEHAVRQCVVTTPEFNVLVSCPKDGDWQDVLRAADEVAFYVFICSNAQADATSMITDALCAVQHDSGAYSTALAAFASTLARDSVRLLHAVEDAHCNTGWSRVSIVSLLRKCYAIPSAIAREGNVPRDIAAMVAVAEFLQGASLPKDVVCENASRACILAAPAWVVRMEKALCAQVVREARAVSDMAAALEEGATGAHSASVLLAWMQRTVGQKGGSVIVPSGEQRPMSASDRVEAAEDTVLASSSLIGPLMHRSECCSRLMYAPSYEGVAHPWVASAIASMRAAVNVLRGCGEFNTMLGRGDVLSAKDVVLLMSFACIALHGASLDSPKQNRAVPAMRALIIRVDNPGARAASLVSVNDISIGMRRFVVKEARPAQHALLAQVTVLTRMLLMPLVNSPPTAADVLSAVMATETVDDDASESPHNGLPRPAAIDDIDGDDDSAPMVLSPFTGGALSVSYYRGTPRLTAAHVREANSDAVLHSVERSPHGFVVYRDGNSPSPLHISRTSLVDPGDKDLEHLLYGVDGAPSNETVRLVRTPDYDTYDNEDRWRSASRIIGELEDGNDDGAALPVLIAFAGEDANSRGRKTRWFTRSNALHAARFVGLLRHEPLLIVDVFVRDVSKDASSGAPYHVTVAYLPSGLSAAIENDESVSVSALLLAALDEARLGMDVATIRPRQAAYENAMHPVGVAKDKSKTRHALDAVFGELQSTPGVLPRLFNCFTLSVHRSERNKENGGRAPSTAHSQRVFERAWVSLPNSRDTAHFLDPLPIENIPAFIRTTLASDSVIAADKAVGGFAAAWVNLTQLDGELGGTLSPLARLAASGAPTLVALYRAAVGGGLAYTPEDERTAQLEHALRLYFGSMDPGTLAWEGGAALPAAPSATAAFVADVWRPACRAILQALSVATPSLMVKGYKTIRAFGIARGDSPRELRDKASAYTKAVVQRTAFSRSGVEGVAAAGRTRDSTFQFRSTTPVPATLLSGTMLSEPFPPGIYPSIVLSDSSTRPIAAISFAATNSVLSTGTGVRCGTKPVVAIAQELAVTQRDGVDHVRRQDVDVDDAVAAYVRLWLDAYKTFFAYEEQRGLESSIRRSIILPTANTLLAMDSTFSTWGAPQTAPVARLLVDICLAHADTRLALPWERPEWTQAVKYYGFRDMGIPVLYEAALRAKSRRVREGSALRML